MNLANLYLLFFISFDFFGLKKVPDNKFEILFWSSLYYGRICQTNVQSKQDYWDLAQATKWSGDQIFKYGSGSQMSGKLKAGDQMTD